MALKANRSRVHLLAAREAPTIAILQRKRSKLFHVSTIHAERLEVTEGSWFRGKLYPLRCDLSFDGKLMVYLAMGAGGKTWNGVCCPPWLTTLFDTENTGTWYGGGYFAERRRLRTNGWGPPDGNAIRSRLRLAVEPYASAHGGEDLGVLYERLTRDGYQRLGRSWGTQRRLPGRNYQVACDGDDGWGCRPSRKHPELQVRFVGYLTHGYTFAFALEGSPKVLDGATWATWDAGGNLWVARPGVVEKFKLKDLGRGAPSFALDVDLFEPPPRQE